MKTKIKKLAVQIEVILLCILPWAAYALLLWNYQGKLRFTIMIGWLFLLVYQIMSSAFLINESENKKSIPIQQWLMGVVVFILTLHQIITDGSLMLFLLEKIVIDAVSIVLIVIVSMFIFIKDMGITPLILGALIGMGCFQFIEIYWNILQEKSANWITYSQVGSAFLINCYAQARILHDVVKGKVILTDIFEQKNGIVLILGQVLLWLLLPVIIYFLKNFFL